MSEWKWDAIKAAAFFFIALTSSGISRDALFFFSGCFFTFMVTELQDRRAAR